MLYNIVKKRVKKDIDCLTCPLFDRKKKICMGINKICFDYNKLKNGELKNVKTIEN